jgi:hypothetical protein
MKRIVAGLCTVLLPLPLLAGQETTKVPPGTPVTITVTPAAPAAPPVSITLKDRHGHVTPDRSGCTHTGGGNIDVQQPSPDTVVITMTGVATATGGPHGSSATLNFDLEQCFDVVFEKETVKAAKVTLEGRVIGLLRSGCKGGSAAESGGCASVVCGKTELVTVCVPDHAVAGGENLSINDKAGPASVPIGAGTHTLHQAWVVSAAHPRALFGKAASAEFAPDPALDPLWIRYWEPFHGVKKDQFGFQVILKVAADTEEANGAKKEGEALPVPKPEKKEGVPDKDKS